MVEVEVEMTEDFPFHGSLRRARHREDSAYMSQRDSLSGLQDTPIPDTPSPKTDGEEDQNEYVLPGHLHSPERGDWGDSGSGGRGVVRRVASLIPTPAHLVSKCP